MTDHIRESLLQVTAAEDWSSPALRYKAVTLAGTIAANNKNVAGILKFTANSGYTAGVVAEGFTKAFVGGAVNTVGWPLKATTSGFLVAAASGDQVSFRLRDTTAASGDLAPVIVDLVGLQVWGG